MKVSKPFRFGTIAWCCCFFHLAGVTAGDSRILPSPGLLKDGPQVLYPISPGKGEATTETQSEFRLQVQGKIRELLARPSSKEQSEKLGHILAYLLAGRIERVVCKAARAEHFDKAKKKAGNCEFCNPWKRTYSNPVQAYPQNGGECYRDYFEPQVGEGFSIYAARIRGQITLLEIWLVPEVV